MNLIADIADSAFHEIVLNEVRTARALTPRRALGEVTVIDPSVRCRGSISPRARATSPSARAASPAASAETSSGLASVSTRFSSTSTREGASANSGTSPTTRKPRRMDAKTSAMCRTSPVAATASTDATSSARPAAFASVSRACSIRAFTLSTDASVRTESRDAPSASSRRRKMPWMRDCRLFVSCSTRSISATARGMRRRPETDCSSSAREMSSAMSWSFISTSARCFSTCSGSWDGHLRSRAAEGGEVSDRRSGDEEAKRARNRTREVFRRRTRRRHGSPTP